MARGVKTGGRAKGTPNKATARVKELALEHGPAVVAMLAKMALNPKVAPASRILAGREILDRAYGKATQSVELGGPDGGPIVSQQQIVRLRMTPVEELPE